MSKFAKFASSFLLIFLVFVIGCKTTDTKTGAPANTETAKKQTIQQTKKNEHKYLMMPAFDVLDLAQIHISKEKLTDLIGEPGKYKILFYRGDEQPNSDSHNSELAQRFQDIRYEQFPNEIEFYEYFKDALELNDLKLENLGLNKDSLPTAFVFDKQNRVVCEITNPTFYGLRKGLAKAGFKKHIVKSEIPEGFYEAIAPEVAIKGKKLEKVIGAPGKFKLFLYTSGEFVDEKSRVELVKEINDLVKKYPADIEFHNHTLQTLSALDLCFVDLGLYENDDCILIVFTRENKPIWQISYPYFNDVIEGLVFTGFDKLANQAKNNDKQPK